MRNPLIERMILEPDNINALENLLEKNPNLLKFSNKDDFQGNTPLTLAGLLNNFLAAQLFVKCGAISSEQNSFLLNIFDNLVLRSQKNDNKPAFIKWLTDDLELPFRSDLHRTVFFGNQTKTSQLLANGAPINTNNDVSPLHYAIANEDFEMAEFLLANGADINAKDGQGNTPLHYAALKNQINAAKFLLERGADRCAQNARGTSPLHYAVAHNHSVAELLISEETLALIDNYNLTPFKLAIYCGQLEMVKLLLSKGAKKALEESDPGWSPILLALQFGQRIIAEFLVNYCQKNSITFQLLDANKKTPFHYAASARLGANLECLDIDFWIREQPQLWIKLDPSCTDHECTDSLEWLYEHKEWFLRALKLDENQFQEILNAPDKNGHTCAHYAAYYGCVKNLQHLYEWGADILAADLKGNNAFDFAIANEQLSIVAWLLEHNFYPRLGTPEIDRKCIDYLFFKKCENEPHLLNGLRSNKKHQTLVDSPPRKHLDNTQNRHDKQLDLFNLLSSHGLSVSKYGLTKQAEKETSKSMKSTSLVNALNLFNKSTNKKDEKDSFPSLGELVIAYMVYSTSSGSYQYQNLPNDLIEKILDFLRNKLSTNLNQTTENKELYSTVTPAFNKIISSVTTLNEKIRFQKALEISEKIISNTELTVSHKFFILRYLIRDLLESQKPNKQQKIVPPQSIYKELVTLLVQIITYESLDPSKINQLKEKLEAKEKKSPSTLIAQEDTLSEKFLSIINDEKLGPFKKFSDLYVLFEKFLINPIQSLENLKSLLDELYDQVLSNENPAIPSSANNSRKINLLNDDIQTENIPTLKRLSMLAIFRLGIFNTQAITPNSGIKKRQQFETRYPEITKEFNFFGSKLPKIGRFALAPQNNTLLEIYYLCHDILEKNQFIEEIFDMEFDIEKIAAKEIISLLNITRYSENLEQLKESIRAHLKDMSLKYCNHIETFEDMKNLLKHTQGRKALLQELHANNEQLPFGTYQGWWPLNVAIKLGLEKVVLQLLHKNKSSAHFKNFIPESDCTTPLELALTSPKILAILLDHLVKHSISEEIWQFHNAEKRGLFHAAALIGVTPLELLIETFPNKIEEINLECNGFRVLPNACASGDLEAIQLVVQYSNPESIKLPGEYQHYGKFSPLSIACWKLCPENKSGPEIVRYLFELDREDLNAACSGIHQKTPVQLAAGTRNLAVIAELLKLGANKIIPSASLQPFHTAVFVSHYEGFKLLVDEETLAKNINQQQVTAASLWGCASETILHTAITHANNDESIDIINHLLKNQADINASNSFDETPILCVKPKENKKKTVEILELLINKGADVNQLHPKNNSSVLHNVAGHFEAMKLLFEYGLDSDFVNFPNQSGDTPLCLVGQYRNDDIDKSIQLLFEKGARKGLLKSKRSGKIPLHDACYYQNLKAFQILFAETVEIIKKLGLEIREIINKSTDSGTMLHSCLKQKDSTGEGFKILTLLLENGATVKVSDDLGNTPLHLAIENGNLPAVKTLLKRGANANLPNKRGETPLHYAVRYKFNKKDSVYLLPIYDFYPAAEMVQVLLQHGAAQSIEKVNERGKTPMDIAHSHIKPKLTLALELYEQSDTEQSIAEESSIELPSSSH